jgi:hypothetical protein
LSRRHGARAWGILASLLKLLYPALKLGDQFIASINLPDHLAYPGLSVGRPIVC